MGPVLRGWDRGEAGLAPRVPGVTYMHTGLAPRVPGVTYMHTGLGPRVPGGAGMPSRWFSDTMGGCR